MFRAQGSWVRFSERFKFLGTRSFCNNPKSNPAKSSNITANKVESYDEMYRQLPNLDMWKAANMVLNAPKKKFGFDFHLVQFFFACLPSLAVYLVAQYARYEMRKMEVEVEKKRKQKEEEEAKEKEKEMELNPPEERESKSDPQLLEVKKRLYNLEEAVKEIVVEKKKQSSSNPAKNQVTGDEKKHLNSSAPSDANVSASNKAADEPHSDKHNSLKPKPKLGDENTKGSMATPNYSL